MNSKYLPAPGYWHAGAIMGQYHILTPINKHPSDIKAFDIKCYSDVIN